jgi:4,5-dihydroxyphthalate decarboxylase
MTTSTATLTLDTVFNETNQSCKPLREGMVQMQGIEMRHIPVPNIIVPFRATCRYQPYDISELAVVTYMAARHYGVPVTAIPVFPATRVDYGQGISINTKYAKTAKDLEGKAVGMRAYTVTATTKQCAYLIDQGCDLSKVTLISNDEEHVRQFHPDAPKNLVYMKGANLRQMLIDGEIAAAFSAEVPDHPEIQPLNPRAREEGIERFKRDGLYHFIHLITVSNRVLEKHPWVLESVYNGFKASKQAWIDQRGGPPDPWDDPMPLGMSQVRSTLEDLMTLVVRQGILPRRYDIDELFPGNLD